MADNQFQFQVNIKGMIELLSEHIYSSPTVFIRELLQNAMDAVTLRKTIDFNFVGKVDIYFQGSQIIFQDNGVGLSVQDVHDFLSVIGQSSKTGELADKDLIGKFGIGMLSCLVVSDQIIVETKSLLTKESVRWIAMADGTYRVEKIADLPNVGTRVILKAKKKWRSLFSWSSIKQNVLFYGSALPIAVNLIQDDVSEQCLDGTPVWLNKQTSKAELLQYGKDTFKTNFLDVFHLYSNIGELQGVAFILPNKVNGVSNKEHKIFVKRMYLCDKATNLLPEWTSFVRCIINTNTLSPTASRESLVNNTLLQQTKKELTDCFKEYLKNLKLLDPFTLEQIIGIHHMYIKSLAASDNEILQLFEDFLPFETNHGTLSFGEIKQNYPSIYYTWSLDEFRQIRRIAGSQNKLVINAAYSYEMDLIDKIRIIHPQLSILNITPNDLLSDFNPATEDTDTIKEFLARANVILKHHYCEAKINQFEPVDTTAIYIISEEALSSKNIVNLSKSTNVFASTLGHFAKKQQELPVLCFNQSNDLVQKLVSIEDNELFESLVNVLYVQSLMLGGYTINKKEMDTFNDALYQFMILGMSNFLPKI